MLQPQAILQVNNLAVQRDGTRILRGVNWAVAAGQHWAILGSNGSGKTSLLKAITGYLMPSRGEVKLLGHIYGESDWRELRKCVGIVSSAVSLMIPDDEPALDTVSSGPSAVIGLWQSVKSSERTAARRLLRQLGCGPLAIRPWGVLSQGERQRILIARALMAKPRLLILDEPCAGLDPMAREHFLQFLNKLGRQASSPALVLVTHHVEEIVSVFSHVLVLKNGQVLVAGRKISILTSNLMKTAFGGAVRVQRTARGRYALRVAPTRDGVV